MTPVVAPVNKMTSRAAIALPNVRAVSATCGVDGSLADPMTPTLIFIRRTTPTTVRNVLYPKPELRLRYLVLAQPLLPHELPTRPTTSASQTKLFLAAK